MLNGKNELLKKMKKRNRSHSLAADRLLQGFNRGQIAPKCVFPTDYALKPEKGCWLSGGKVNNYEETEMAVECSMFDVHLSIYGVTL